MTMIASAGYRAPEPEELYDVHEQEYLPEEVERSQRRLKAKDGQIVGDNNKFNKETRRIALYRKNGTRSAVPKATYQTYLKKRTPSGERVFSVRPQGELPVLASDPCPCTDVDGDVCGKRMKDQWELFQHITKKHRDQAMRFLSPQQIETMRKDLVPGLNTPGLSLEPSVPPTVAVGAEENVMELAVDGMAQLAQDIIEAEKEAMRPKRANKHIPTCSTRGMWGRYTEGCPRCEALKARG